MNEGRERAEHEAYLQSLLESLKRELDLIGYHGRIQDHLLEYTIRRLWPNIQDSDVSELVSRAWAADLVFKESEWKPSRGKRMVEKPALKPKDSEIEKKREILALYRTSGAVTQETITELEKEISDLEKGLSEGK